MKHENYNYFMVGSFTLLMLFVLMFTFYKITGRTADAAIYYTYYGKVSGIRVGTTITYSGYEIGQLIDIEPVRNNNQTRYKLSLAIKSDWQIPDDSIIRVVSAGLLAENQLDISEGRSTAYLAAGDSIKSKAAVDMMALLEAFSGEFNNLADTGLKPILENINKQITHIGEDNISNIASSTRTLIHELNTSASQLNKLLTDKNTQHMSRVIANSDATMNRLAILSDRVEKSTTNLESLVRQSNELIGSNKDDLRQAVVDLRNSLNAIAQNMETIMYNLDTASRDISEFSHQIRSNPGVLLNSSPPKDKAK